MTYGVPHFIHSGKLTHPQMADSFVRVADRLIRFREKHGRPFIARVYGPQKKTEYRTVPGEIKMLLTLAEWEATRRR